jgi:exoribonuclease R
MDIQNLIGILHFSDKEYTICKKNIIFKRFTPFFNSSKSSSKYLVKTKRILETKNMYVKVKENIIIKYIGYVGDLETENNILEELSLCNWNLKINTLFKSLENNDLTNNRLDLTNRKIYTIDPLGSIDIDDGIHYLEMENGIVELGIHIADPTSFIEANSIIDIELNNRSETIYLKKNTYHMMDRDFMINNLSLIKNVIRRSFSLIIIINSNTSEIISYKFVKSTINISNNFTYENIDLLLLNNFIKYAIILKNNFMSSLCILNYDSHKIVEIFMVTANHLAAKTICEKNNKSLIRTQHKTESNHCIINIDDTLFKLYQQLLSNKALYKIYDASENNYHTSLNLSLYTHFTSPIRRYADIIVHRQLSDMSDQQIISPQKLNYLKSFYKSIVNHEIMLHILNIIGPQDYIELDGYIVYINKDTCGIQCNKLDKVFITKLIHKNMKKVLNIEYFDDRLLIGKLELKLFDKVPLRLCKNLYGLNKIKTYIRFDFYKL